jgi:hypothetical protein
MAKRKAGNQIASQPLKFENRFAFLACRWHATYSWTTLNESYNFSSDLTSIGGLHTKLWASKVVGDLILEFSKLPLGSPETK